MSKLDKLKKAAKKELERRKKLPPITHVTGPTMQPVYVVQASGSVVDDAQQRLEDLLKNRKTIITEGGLPESYPIGAPIIGEARDPTKIDLTDEQVVSMVTRADALEARLELRLPDWERQSIQHTIITLRQRMARRRQ